MFLPAAENIDTSGLSLLAFNTDATNIEQTQSAQDAVISVNGLSVSRESNVVSGAIPGVTLNLKQIDIGNPVQVAISNQNVSEAQDNIKSFVDGFNELASVFSGLTQYGGEGGTNGVLLGDTVSRNILQQVRRELGGVIDNGGSFNSLSSIGISTNRDGSLTLDSSVLSSALKSDFDSVAKLFYANANASDSEVLFSSSSTKTQEGSYQVSISSLATQGQFTAESVTGPITIDATNDSFSFLVDGISTGTVSITQGSYSDLNNLAQEIQNRINAAGTIQTAGIDVAVSYTSGNAFEITSSSYGSDSNISVTSQNSDLGFTSNAVATDGTDVIGSIGGKVATGSGRFLTGSGDAAGLVLEITGSATGNRGSVTYSQGIASKLDSLLSVFQSSGGQLSTKTDSINQQIESIAEQRTTLLKRVADIEARYRKQFSSLDVLISQMNSTSDFLQQQLDSLPGVSRNGK